MLLFHATPLKNLESIRDYGLDPDYSRGRLRAVWLHTGSVSEPIAEYTSLRHGVQPGEIVLIPVVVPRSRIRRFRRCLWYTLDLVPPDRLILPGGSRFLSQSIGRANREFSEPGEIPW